MSPITPFTSIFLGAKRQHYLMLEVHFHINIQVCDNPETLISHECHATILFTMQDVTPDSVFIE